MKKARLLSLLATFGFAAAALLGLLLLALGRLEGERRLWGLLLAGLGVGGFLMARWLARETGIRRRRRSR